MTKLTRQNIIIDQPSKQTKNERERERKRIQTSLIIIESKK